MIARLLIISLLLLSSNDLIQADPVNGQVKSVSGDAILTTAGGKTEKITSTTVIPPGSKISTNANSRLIIEWVPGAFSIVYPISNVGISALAYSKPTGGTAQRQVSLHLLKGSIFSHLVHNDGTSDFRIKTPEGVAAARGTDWFTSFVGGIVKVTVLADTVTCTLPSGRVVNVNALFEYILGDPDSSHLTEAELNLLLQDFRDAGLTVTLQDINDAHVTAAKGTVTSGYIITFSPSTGGDGFQFFIPRWVGEGDEWFHRPLGEPPFLHVPVASP